jgi:hypothetical protein
MNKLNQFLEDLEKKAKAATQDKWQWSDGANQGSYLADTLINFGDSYEGAEADRAFTEQLSPATVLKLIEVIRRQQEDLYFYGNEKHYDDTGAPGRSIFHRTLDEGDQYDFEPDDGNRARQSIADIERMFEK